MKLKIAFLQILPEGSVEANLRKGLAACREAKELGAELALFPEMWSTGYTFPCNAIAAGSPFVQQFAAMAEELNMAIAITLLERQEPKPRNSVCLFDRRGKLLYRYSKVHICDFGEENDEGVLEPGDGFPVARLETEEGSICVGSMICYDREFPESARVLMLEGAELILVPNACPMEINRLSQLRARAYENMLAIATCNYPAGAVDCNGHSTLFDGVAYAPGVGSRDMCVTETGSEEGIFLAELDVDALRDYRRRELCGMKNRRPELYGRIAEK